jgi:cellobiose transport system substrate-binding protein
MSRSSKRRRGATLLAVAALGASVLAGCGSSSSSDASTGADAGPCVTSDDTTLTVGVFGNFGLKEAGLGDDY